MHRPLKFRQNVENARQLRSRPFVVLTYSPERSARQRTWGLPVERRVLACRGWEGKKGGHFEHPALPLIRSVFQSPVNNRLRIGIAPAKRLFETLCALAG